MRVRVRTFYTVEDDEAIIRVCIIHTALSSLFLYLYVSSLEI